MIQAIEELLVDDTAGDPMGGLKWTRKTTEKVSVELVSAGIHVSPNTVGRLLTGAYYVSDKTLRIDALEQHHAGGGRSLPARRGERHGGGLGDGGRLLRPLEKLDEARDGIHMGSPFYHARC